ncbi:hypothetical protein Q2T40_21655 [Winogradskyella maritima]|nr:hypothetical protein [Winogradskyella maritima]
MTASTPAFTKASALSTASPVTPNAAATRNAHIDLYGDWFLSQLCNT